MQLIGLFDIGPGHRRPRGERSPWWQVVALAAGALLALAVGGMQRRLRIGS